MQEYVSAASVNEILERLQNMGGHTGDLNRDFKSAAGFEFVSERPVYYKKYGISPGIQAEIEKIFNILKSGELKEYGDALRLYDYVDVYTGGAYPKVLRLGTRVPTFDYSDRLYDSWRGFYLFRDAAGKTYAASCGGGARLSFFVFHGEVSKYPSELAPFLEE